MSRWWPTLLLTGLGAVIGLVLSFLAGAVCVDGVTDSFCGKSFLVWNMTTGAAVGLWAATGALVGAVVGLVTSFAFSRRSARARPRT